MISNRIERFFLNLFGRCPDCAEKLDNDYHGFNHKWQHCHNCPYCTYDDHTEDEHGE